MPKDRGGVTANVALLLTASSSLAVARRTRPALRLTTIAGGGAWCTRRHGSGSAATDCITRSGGPSAQPQGESDEDSAEDQRVDAGPAPVTAATAAAGPTDG
jgi:hypothetical protein